DGPVRRGSSRGRRVPTPMGVISPSISPSLAALHDRISQIQSQLAAPGFPSALAQATATSTATAPTAAPATTATRVATAARAPPTTWAPAAAASAATAAPGSSGPATGEQIVALAGRHLGVPYRWGGTGPAHGLDCSGLVQVVFRDAGIELPRVSRDQARVG